MDQTAQPTRLSEDRSGDLDTACPHQDEIALRSLILGMGGLEMLVPAALRPPAGLRQPQRGVIGCPYGVVSEM